MLLKGGKNYHGIGLFDVVWKAVTVLLNFCFATSITYHESLHGFWSGRGTGTTSLEIKLLQKVMAIREEALYIIFLDIHTVYYDLERSRLLDILEGYGMGPRDLLLL